MKEIQIMLLGESMMVRIDKNGTPTSLHDARLARDYPFTSLLDSVQEVVLAKIEEVKCNEKNGI